MGKFADQLRAFALKTEGLQERTVRLAVLDVWSRLIVRSPVDTGRFRAAWTTSYDEIVARSVSRGALPLGVYGPPRPPVISEKVIGRRFYISNSLPYAQKLEDGGSQQAPQGMVRLTAMEWPQVVRRAVAAARTQTDAS